MTATCLRPNPSPRDTPTRLPTRSPTPCSTPSWPQDPTGRVACETLVTTGLALIAGEITTKCYVDFSDVVRETIKEIGYTRAKYGFDYETCAVISSIDEQSPDIAMGVDTGGAGDQGLMFGFACRETEELMPLPIMLAHKLCRRLSRGAAARGARLPAARRQVPGHRGVRGRAGRSAWRPSSSRPSTASSSSQQTMREDIIEKVIKPVIPADLIDKNTKFHVNPTGRFVIGGPQGDTGVTGRKIIVDTYGGAAPHGGGAFSGKDPTKVDRSACYMARYIAKNFVAAGLADRVLVQLAYAIGVADPVSVMVDTYGTGSSPTTRSRSWSRALPADAARHHRGPRPAAPDLREDGRVRPLRPLRAGIHLGADRPRGGPACRGRPLSRPATT